MIYFADLTPYSYDGAAEDGRIVNVGWLSNDHSFPRGSVPQEFVDRLIQLTKSPTNLCRGVHFCECCQQPEEQSVNQSGLRMVEPDPETTGNGEIRVSGENGMTFVAPALIWHYVCAHGYLPPQAFIDAVQSGRQ